MDQRRKIFTMAKFKKDFQLKRNVYGKTKKAKIYYGRGSRAFFILSTAMLCDQRKPEEEISRSQKALLEGFPHRATGILDQLLNLYLGSSLNMAKR